MSFLHPADPDPKSSILDTYDRAKWVEDVASANQRATLTHSDRASLVRRLYPFSARMIRGDRTYQEREGTVFPYARTKHVPATFPIEVSTYGVRGALGVVRARFYSSLEVELIPPID